MSIIHKKSPDTLPTCQVGGRTLKLETFQIRHGIKTKWCCPQELYLDYLDRLELHQ